MKTLRKQNPVLFDLILFVGFCIASFAAYILAQEAGAAGATAAVILLAVLCLVLIISN